ncbi:MAG TPA: autotransporter-associated beta strand repeat-containing protein [Opitutaceae bacterium]|nr:autotransporter-associated beta strand repeat-containing protein [Opitutaceae bacterium]
MTHARLHLFLLAMTLGSFGSMRAQYLSFSGSNVPTGTYSEYDFVDISNTAGDATFLSTASVSQSITFYSATGGTARIVNQGTAGNRVNFTLASDAANAWITNEGGLNTVFFIDTATAGSALIENLLSARLEFKDSTSAGSATVQSPTGTVDFSGSSTGGNATLSGNTFYFRENSSLGAASLTVSDSTGFVDFSSAASAGSGTIANYGGTYFRGGAGAGTAAITNHTDGIVLFEGSSSLGSSTITNSGTVIIQDVANAATATINNVGASSLVDLSSYAGPVSLGAVTGGGTLKIGGSAVTFGTNGTAATFDGAITDEGAGGSVILNTMGALVLTGANTYAGGTTVSAGRLFVNNAAGSGLGSGAVSVLADAELGGAGFIAGAVEVMTDGLLNPGQAPHAAGILTIEGGLTLHAGSLLVFDLGASSDLLQVTGGTFSTPEAGVSFYFSPRTGFAAGTYNLIDATGATLGLMDPGDFTILGPTAAYDSFFSLDGNVLSVTFTAIPEPSTYAALVGAGALGFAAWRRRRAGV